MTVFGMVFRVRSHVVGFLVTLVWVILATSRPITAQIAPGVLQSAAHTATVTGTVVRSDGTPVIGADVRLIGTAQFTTKSDVHGAFNFTSVPYGTYSIIVSAVNLGTTTRNTVSVNGDLTVVIQYETPNSTGSLKEIARVSTRSSGAQINVTPASIASVNPSDYAFQGNTSWQQLLDGIPGVAVSGGLEGGTIPPDIIPGGPLQSIVLSINGGLPYETSTTLDGMPLYNIAYGTYPGYGTNIAYLPMSTFETADVVRGPGANAPSVVDSIGGSFVLHVPGQVDKNQFEFSASNDPYGGIVANAKAALRFGRLFATIVYGINDSPGPLGTQHVIGALFPTPATVNGQAFAGCPSGCYNEISNPNYQYCYGQCGLQNELLLDGVPTSTVWTQHNGALSLSYDITSAITMQLFYAGSSSQMNLPPGKFAVDFAPASGYAGSIVPGQYEYLSAYQAPYVQSQSLLEEKLTASLGKGVLRLAALQNNSFEQLLQSSPPNGSYVLYGTGSYESAPGTPVNFNGTAADVTFTPFMYHVEQWSNNRDMLASYAVQIGTASHVGVSYTTSYYNSPYWSTTVVGAISIPGGRPSAISEKTDELRINAGTEVTNKLSLDASWYFTRGSYHLPNPADPTGNTYVDSIFPYNAPRLGAVWRMSRDIAIRAAAGGGYALPGLLDLIGTDGVFFCGPYYIESKPNLNLQPEKSFGIDIGTDMRLTHNTVLSFDLYRSNLYGQFYSSLNLTSTNYSGSGLPLYTYQEGNLSKSRYEGMNITINHDVPKGIYWHGALGFTRAYVVSVPAGFYDQPGLPNSLNLCIVPGINFNGSIAPQGAVPYANGSGQLGYRWTAGKYIDVSTTYYGNNNAYFVPAFFEFDAHAGYAFTRNFSVLATFRNITGIYGQNYQLYLPTMTGPTIAGAPVPLVGTPYGPRSLIVTANFKE